jgi:hypothetical protein
MDAKFANSLAALNYWAQSEGSVTNNPLATSGQGAGATKCVAQCGGTSPIYEYDNESDGVAQMARFMQGSYYTAIVKSLINNASLATIFQAINNSPWCKGCQAAQGGYPEDLAAAVNGHPIAISGSVGVGSGGTAGSGGAGVAGSGSAGSNSTGAGAGASLSECVVQLPGFLFLSGPCLLTKGGVKWLSGVAALGAGVVVGTFGVIILAAYGFNASGAKQAVTKVAGTLPGPQKGIVRAAGGASGGARKASGATKSAAARTVGLGPSAAPERPVGARGPGISGNQRATERDLGRNIGPRGGTGARRRPVSSPGAPRRAPRRQPAASERRRPVVRRGEGFGGAPGAPDGPQ